MEDKKRKGVATSSTSECFQQGKSTISIYFGISDLLCFRRPQTEKLLAKFDAAPFLDAVRTIVPYVLVETSLSLPSARRGSFPGTKIPFGELISVRALCYQLRCFPFECGRLCRRGTSIFEHLTLKNQKCALQRFLFQQEPLCETLNRQRVRKKRGEVRTALIELFTRVESSFN